MVNIEDLNYELSEFLRLSRAKKRRSQEAAANILDISRNTYSIRERNPKNMTLKTLLDMSNKLDDDVLIFFKDYVAKRNDREEE